MTGKITVSRTGNWLTPYEVEVAIDGRPATTTRFPAPARAQIYTLAMAEAHDLDVLYDVDRPAEAQPRRISSEEFAETITRICAKCRTAVPLSGFRVLTHRNRHTDKGREVHHGWSEECLKCEAARG